MPKLCTLKNISYTFDGNCVFSDISWTMEEGKVYSVVGGNGTGKTVLAEIIAGRRGPSSGEVVYHADGVGYFSFEEQEKVLARERRMDTTWFGDGKTDYGTSGVGLMGLTDNEGNLRIKSPEVEEYLRILKLEEVIDRGCRQYSTGEFRKVLICREIINHPELLIVDEPYDGLDRESRLHLEEIFSHVKEKGMTLLLFLSREEEVPEYTDEVQYLYGGGLHSGPEPRNDSRTSAVHLHVKTPSDHHLSDSFCEAPLISMKNVEVFYEGKPVLKNIDWQAWEGDTWMITGPNGAGKSTLLSLITGDNPKAYGQDIFLFGNKRGSGESVWDIKKKIGFVSGDFQYRYYIRSSVMEVVLSGFFDSIGLYQKVSEYETHAARERLKDINLLSKKDEPFAHLSFGEKRMVLIARAMIKAPKVLIADEPCQGLDDKNRDDVLSTLERIAVLENTLLLYVTHNPKEFLRCPYHHLELVPDDAGGYTCRVAESPG
jgi:molybdate transport system ATP-binding protein